MRLWGSVKIVYVHSQAAWHGFSGTIRCLIRDSRSVRIAEVGAGANPTLPLDYVREQGLDYTLIDISEAELAKAPAGYHKIVADAGSPGLMLQDQFDFIFSNNLAEHVADAEQFHRNVFNLLRPGGLAFHYFPTLFSFPMVTNQLMGDGLGQRLLDRMLPGLRTKSGKMAKFPAYYHWCFGPFAFQERRFAKVGFQVVEYRGTFGYHGYFERHPRLLPLHERITQWSLRHPLPWFTSGAQVLLSKGGSSIQGIPPVAEFHWW
jgi:SAM-dependent methyltransferase